MRKVKEFWELIDVLKAQGYEWNRTGLHNNKLYPSYFSSTMFELCGRDPSDVSYTWHDDWLQPEENKDIGKFCKFWDADEEPANDSSDVGFSFLVRQDSCGRYPFITTDQNEYAHYRVVDVDIK